MTHLMSLTSERYVNLATFRKNGVAVETPVWFAEHDGSLYVFTAGDSGKVKRLRRSSRARLAPCDIRGRVRGDWRDAKARVVDDPAVLAAAYRALHRKYGFQMWLADFLSRLSGRIHRRAMIEIELD
jgi:PPOX class probable F420-dependent enzyme